jgi:hypothetical protein
MIKGESISPHFLIHTAQKPVRSIRVSLVVSGRIEED